MSSGRGYQPKPTVAQPTGVHEVVPNRAPSIAAIRPSFEDTFGAYLPADWTLDAECTRPGIDPAIFFPRSGGHGSNRALKVCETCAVRAECLEDALAFESGEVQTGEILGQVEGVRGGMSAKRRRPLANQRSNERQEKLRAAVVKDYADGMPVEEIVSKHGVAQTSTHRWVRDAGVPLRAGESS